MLEKTIERPLDCKEIKPINPKGNQPWISIGKTEAEAEVPILWPPDAKSWLIRKNLDARKDWRQEEKGATEDKMAGWYHWLNGHEFEQTPGDDEGQGNLACAVHGVTNSCTRLSDWTTTTKKWTGCQDPEFSSTWLIVSSVTSPEIGPSFLEWRNFIKGPLNSFQL